MGGTNVKPQDHSLRVQRFPCVFLCSSQKDVCSCLCFIYQIQALHSKGDRSEQPVIANTNCGTAIQCTPI